MSVLITLPDSDLTTRCISEWNKDVLFPIIRKRKIRVHILDGNKVTRSHFEHTVSKEDPRLLIINGHGDLSGESVYGQAEIIVKQGVNDRLFDSRIVHSFTCCSAKGLGKKSPAEAFIGYDNVFAFSSNRSTTTKPLQDNFAKPPIYCALMAPHALLRGKTAAEAYEESQKNYQQHIDEYLWNSDKHTAEELQRVLPFLLWNMQHQVVAGNPNAAFIG